MSDEQLAEAKAELIQRYMTLKSRLALVHSKITGWERLFGRLSREMPVFASTGIPQDCLHYPSPVELQGAVEDWRETGKEIAVVRQQMQDAGINLS